MIASAIAQKHHEMPSVFLPHQSTGQQREPCLHEEHQVSREKRPREVCGNAEMPDIIGKLHGERLSGRLSLELVMRSRRSCRDPLLVFERPRVKESVL
jgi:hypothetical protein